jgi:protein-S-isoprenylcysteine O-methyltransferase Ste14
MPELALALWLVYGVAALGLRVAIHLRRTGSTGLVGARSAPWTLPWLAEVGHVIALPLGVSAPVLDLLDVLDPIAALNRGAVHATGVVLFGLGLTGVVVGQTTMGSSWRIGLDPRERTALVTGGPFSLVRNPIFSSLIPLLLGLALVVPSAVALASVVLFFASVQMETRLVEEPYLRRVHGEAYASYASRVGRFLPGIGRLRGP